jgi:drug/metabolite transporter (DMT)-like permease
MHGHFPVVSHCPHLGGSYVAQVVASGHIGMFTFNGIRFALGALSLLPVIFIFEGKQLTKEKIKKAVPPGLLTGMALFTASTLQQYGVKETASAGEAGFLTGLYTVLVPVLGILFRKKPTLFTAGGTTLALVGLYFVSVKDSFSISWGHWVMIIGAFFWAWHIIAVDFFVSKVPSLTFACIQFSVCAVLSLGSMVLFEEVVWQNLTAALPVTVYSGLMSVGVAFTLQILGQKKADPAFAAIVLSTESVFSAIGGALILGETMTARGYVGCTLIFCGIVVSQLKDVIDRWMVKKPSQSAKEP